MSELGAIERLARQAAARRRLQRGWLGLWWGFLSGSGLYLLVLALYKLAPVSYIWVTIAGIIGLAALPIGFFIGWFQKISATHMARWLDARKGLKERLATALEMGRAKADSPWANLVVADAAQAANQVDLRRMLPWKLPNVSRWVALLLVVVGGLGFAPEYRTKTFLQKQKQVAAIKDAGKNLSLLTRRQLETRKPVFENTQKSLDQVAELGDRLQQARLSRQDALKDLANATDRLKEELRDFQKNPAIKPLEKIARTPSGMTQQSSAALQKQIDALQKQLGDKAGKSDALDQLKKDLQALKDAAKGLADKDGADAAAARAQLAKAAAELARKAESLGQPLPSLDEAVAALNAAKTEQFLRDLNVAEKDLEKMADMARTLAQLQQQAEKLGKDLGEQLKNGQAQAAVETLQKMRELLKKASPDQLASTMNELKNALKPAAEYGEVADHLKSALAGLEKAAIPGAERSLEAAQKALEDMLGEMGDLQGLMASLQNLQKAQMCIGSGLTWGECKGNKIGLSLKGSRGGKGYGTWAGDNPWAMPDHIDDLWDNSGQSRPDMDGRGHTDRDVTTPEGLTPTKVKGQLQPGGPMPSITLRGVSIKGQSSVEYSEAVTAAQSEARASLNQEKVPRAYQGAVRDYFDDLK